MQPILSSTTIVALASGYGQGAISVIRLSGNEAILIVSKFFRGKNLIKQSGYTLHFGEIINNDEVIDEVLITLFKAPKSYTGEDVVEISCHASSYIIDKIIQLCIANGAQLAMPGEFTQRAFLNGKMDLTQAEAVADLIASNAAAAHKAAMHNLKGGFKHVLDGMREQLIHFTALIQLELDFSDEDVTFADRTQLLELLNKLNNKTNQLIQSFSLGNAIKNGVNVAIVGKPNAGKSTLLNALLNEERAIVSAIPGTTRDTVEESININGIIYKLIDTAGIREHTVDEIEAIGIARSKKALEKADIVIFLFDVNDSIDSILKQINNWNLLQYKCIAVGNKCDLSGNSLSFLQQHFAALPIQQKIFISALQKIGIDSIKTMLYDMVIGGKLNFEQAIITNLRHYNALIELKNALTDVQNGLEQNLSGDLLTIDINRCLYFLGTITGKIETDRDILGAIFSKFCIGK
ncbi:tRNA uridine-5-carboxymethylaminomethyl(34) synthesis GTPase MnmE [Hydrotalea sp.]|uniref:tRNA uridine-5-carboxymethylaminomethyl(34) synthesis GTPase MnmE n=1 Tax=Hydrotalea sp. TaxID=2881279 RepID=UPI003D151F09